MRTTRLAIVLLCFAALAATAAWAQPDKGKDWTGFFGMGWSGPQGDTSDTLGSDLIFTGGAVYKPSTWPVGLLLDTAYSNYDVKSELLDAAGFEGDVTDWSISADLMWSRKFGGNVGFYLLGGLSGYYLDANITEDALYVYCDPWWWWCYVDEGEVIVDSHDTTEWGYNAGVGLTFDLASGSQIYLEARYHWIEVDNSAEYVPIVVGFRW